MLALTLLTLAAAAGFGQAERTTLKLEVSENEG